MHVFYKCEFSTGNAWWPICPNTSDFSFDNGQQYKIFGVVYIADTEVFREKWQEACLATCWDRLNK